jgi:peptide/nickel transport system substrate-binding protein
MGMRPTSSRLVSGIMCMGLLAAAAACGSGGGSSGGTSAGTAPAVTTAGSAPTSESATTSETPTTSAQSGYGVSIAFSGDVTTLDPQKVQDLPARTVYGNIFEPLVRRSSDGKTLEPLLAADLPQSVDDTTWEVKLKDNVTFASGKPLTAQDIVYTFTRLFDPKTDSQQADLLKTIKTTTAVDDHTVRFTTDGPDPLLPSRLAYALIIPDGQGEVAGFPESGLDGTGPYELDHHTAGVEVVIKKRSNYWGGDVSAAPDTMTYKVIPDDAARLAALQANELDIDPEITADQATQVPQAAPVAVTESALLRTNTLRGPFADKNLREAASLAIDKDAIVKSLFGGQAQVSDCQIPTTRVFGHTDGLQPSTYDPAQAKQLVQQYYKGEPITLYGIERFAGHKEVAQAVAQNLTDAGFKVDLQFPQSQDQLLAQFSGDKSKYVDLLLFQSSAEVLFDEAQQLQWLTSDGLYSSINDPQIDQLAKTAQTSLDTAARQQAYDQLNKLACDNLYNIYLYYPPSIYGLSNRIDWQPRSDGLVLAQEMTQKK